MKQLYHISKTLIGLLDHFSVKFLYAKIHLTTKICTSHTFIFIILLYLRFPCQHRLLLSGLCSMYFCFSFMYNIVIIEKKKDVISIIMDDNHQTGVNMTYLTMKEYKLTLILQFMVLNNWYTNQPTYFLILNLVLTWFLQTNQT